MEPVLIIGAGGQVGTELTNLLRKKFGVEKVVASDIKETKALTESGPFELLDATDLVAVRSIIGKYEIKQVYLMAAMLSATAEKYPERAWHLNMNSLFNILSLAKEGKIDRIFWPSSIAVFGPDAPKEKTPQNTYMNPSTVYGISKRAGEQWCAYYANQFGIDVRSIRYPGLISWKTKPGGGTTDYAVEIYHKALAKGSYTCFLNENTRLPMMYIDDAVRATVALMEAPNENLSIRSSYNLNAMSLAPKDFARSIKNHIPCFTMQYTTDFRQSIADSWPNSLNDSAARNDWGWAPEFYLERTTQEMLNNLKRTRSYSSP